MITAPSALPAAIHTASVGATQPARFDHTDVPNAEPAHLAHMLAVLIRNGDGLAMLRDDDSADGTMAEALKAVEDRFWAAFLGETATGVAAVVRFRAVVEAFAARRLQSLLLREGLVVLQVAFHVAARLRLNPARGFNPQGLIWAVTAELAAGRRRPSLDRGYADQMAA